MEMNGRVLAPMLMFSAHKGKSFLRAIFETLAILVVIVHGLDYLWMYFHINSPELVWAYSVATGFAALYISMFICFSRQAVYQTRLEEKAVYCADLERKLLKKRQSTSRKN